MKDTIPSIFEPTIDTVIHVWFVVVGKGGGCI